jgi:hypothetical protein
VAAVLAIAPLFPLFKQTVEDVLYGFTMRCAGLVECKHIDEDDLV